MTMLNFHLEMGISGKIPLINFFVITSIRGTGIGGSGQRYLNKENKIFVHGFPLDIHSPYF